MSSAPTGPYFFYGTLMDPSLLTEILGLAEEPQLRPAYVTGYQCKLWGQYPALVSGDPDARVEGAVYHVRRAEGGLRLAAYETGNYTTKPCVVNYTDGEQPSRDQGWTFTFAGDPDDLSDGTFDLEVWLRRMKR